MFAQTCRDNLLALASAYAKARGIQLDSVSKRFYGNRAFLRDLKAKTVTVSIDKFDAVVAKLLAAWPENAEWPTLRAAIIYRPERKVIPRTISAAKTESPKRAAHAESPRRGRGGDRPDPAGSRDARPARGVRAGDRTSSPRSGERASARPS